MDQRNKRDHAESALHYMQVARTWLHSALELDYNEGKPADDESLLLLAARRDLGAAIIALANFTDTNNKTTLHDLL